MNVTRILLSLVAISWANFAGAQQTDSFESIRKFLNDAVENQTIAGGAVLVAHKGDIVFSHGFGFADIESQTPFEVDTPAVIASISKPLMGTTLYRLVDEEKLNVDQPVSEYLPEFTNRKLESGVALNRAPTVTELLTHTSGLRFDSAKSGRIWYQRWTRDKSLEFVVKKVAEEFPFKAQPGTKYAYSGIGTDVAARVGEVVSGLPRNEMLVRYVAQPLAMPNTFYREKTGLEERSITMPTRYYRDKKSGQLRVNKKSAAPEPGLYNASGGAVVSTAPDLMQWLKMIRRGGTLDSGETFLSPESMTAMLKKHSRGNNAAGGLFVRRKDKKGEPIAFGHTGSSGTNVWIDLEYDVIGIMLTQTKSSDIKEFRVDLEARIMAMFSKTVFPEQQSLITVDSTLTIKNGSPTKVSEP